MTIIAACCVTGVICFGLGWMFGFQKAWMHHAKIMDQIETVKLKPGAEGRLMKGLT